MGGKYPRFDSRKRRRPVRRALAISIILFVAALGITCGWLSREYREIPMLSSIVQSEMVQAVSPAGLELGEIKFKLDIVHWQLSSVMERVVLSNQQQRIAVFPKIRFKLSIGNLALGRVVLNQLEVLYPRLHVVRDAEDRLTFNLEDEHGADALPPVRPSDAAALLSGGIGDIVVRELRLRNARVKIDSPEGEPVRWEIPRISFAARRENSGLLVDTQLVLKDGDITTEIMSQSTVRTDTKQSRHQITLDKFPSRLLLSIHPEMKNFQGLDIPVTGEITLIMQDTDIASIAAKLESEGGSYQNTEVLPEPVKIGAIRINAEAGAEMKGVDIEEASIALEDTTITASGTASLDGSAKTDVEIKLTPFGVSRLYRYWPPGLNQTARDWVTSNLIGGTVKNTSARILIRPGELEHEPMPSSLLLATMDIENTKVQYMPGFPPVDNASGKATITATGLHLDISGGKALTGTTVGPSTLDIEDFSAPGVPMKVSLDITTNAPDIATFISKDHLNVAEEMKFDPATILGTAKGTVNLTFPLYSEELPDPSSAAIFYDIKATITGMSQKAIQGKWDVEGMDGTLTLDNSRLLLDSTTKLQTVPAKLRIESKLGKNPSTLYDFKADIPAAKLPTFGFTLPEDVTGTLGIDARISENGKESVTDAKINITQAAFSAPDIGLTKPIGQAGTLNAKILTKGDIETTPSFELKSGDIELQGSMVKNRKTQEVEKLDAPIVRFGKTDAAIKYDTAGDTTNLNISGKRIDLSDNTGKKKTEGGAQAPKKDDNPLDLFKNLKLNLDVGELVFSESAHLKQVKGSATCAQTCSSINLSAMTINNQPFSYKVTSANGTREAVMTSPDAGGVLQGFDVSEHVKGGKMDYRATFTGSTQKGRMTITDFKIMNGPVLARILTLASLTGIIDTLSGKGISFVKLTVDSSFDTSTLKMSKGKAYGSEIGITFSGSLQPFAQNINLKGTVVPAYTANSMLGKIPVLGDLLVGGEGEGIIAARYSVKGNTDSPDVTVNPLSLLTPGFLRNLFDVFDAPEKPAEEQEADAVTPETEPTPASPPPGPAQVSSAPAKTDNSFGKSSTSRPELKTPVPGKKKR